MTLIMSDQSHLWMDIRQELDRLKAENASLRKEVDLLKQNPAPEIDSELLQAINEFDRESLLGADQNAAKKELSGLLDDLEGMIVALNAGTGMGLRVPKEKLNEIRQSLNQS